MYQLYEQTIQMDDGRSITIETGKLAKQADGSVVVTMGKTKLLAAVTGAKEAKEGVDRGKPNVASTDGVVSLRF